MGKQVFLSENISVGEVKQSILTEAQFQSEYGDKWVLMDGRDITGSDLATVTANNTLPDARGQFLRGKNNSRADGQENPDGESAIGLQQTDEFGTHSHAWGGIGRFTPDTGGDTVWKSGSNASATTEEGGNETRPKNITINIFIKINR